MKLYIKYMVSARCKMLVKEILKGQGLHYVVVDLGEVDIMEDLDNQKLEQLRLDLQDSGLELMEDKKGILIEKIKNVIIDMVYHSDGNLKIHLPDYLSEKLGRDYNSMANLFSEVQGITIGQFLIFHKIERIKELIIYGDLNMTEIAWKMNYSSVAHLSNQFKKVTGLTPSHYKQLKEIRNSVENKSEN